MENSGTPASTFPRRPIDYQKALAAQEILVSRRRREEIPDTLWLLEHDPVITSGSGASGDHLLFSREEMATRGFALHATRRGGDVTCHEPGQLVGYPVIGLGPDPADRDLHRYLRRLEESIILLLAELGLESRRVADRPGVWLTADPPRKIAALGVRCAGWVTSHGFSLNVENSLEGFGLIVPCGICDAGVTRLDRELDAARVPSWSALTGRLHTLLERTLQRPLELLRGEEALEIVGALAAE